jgi:uncharacterized membrane protein
MLGRFFPFAWLSSAVLFVSGFAMVFVGYGGLAGIGRYIRLMMEVGLLAVAAFACLYFLPWRAFGEAVKAANWPVAAKNIGRIRLLIVVNLILGTAAVVVGASGRYYG